MGRMVGSRREILLCFWLRTLVSSRSILFYVYLGLTASVAQHFHVADEILVLEQGRIASRGSWDELKSSVSELSKFTFAEATKRPEAVPKTIKRTSQANADAEEDLYRKTGDFSLYCESSTYLLQKKV